MFTLGNEAAVPRQKKRLYIQEVLGKKKDNFITTTPKHCRCIQDSTPVRVFSAWMETLSSVW